MSMTNKVRQRCYKDYPISLIPISTSVLTPSSILHHRLICAFSLILIIIYKRYKAKINKADFATGSATTGLNLDHKLQAEDTLSVNADADFGGYAHGAGGFLNEAELIRCAEYILWI